MEKESINFYKNENNYIKNIDNIENNGKYILQTKNMSIYNIIYHVNLLHYYIYIYFISLGIKDSNLKLITKENEGRSFLHPEHIRFELKKIIIL